jgi:hypothetical protein
MVVGGLAQMRRRKWRRDPDEPQAFNTVEKLVFGVLVVVLVVFCFSL